ncbi:hypothetical protein ACC779_32470 [Rhizobium ruizarguesonis]
MPEFNAHVVLGESLTPVGQLRFTQAGRGSSRLLLTIRLGSKILVPLPCSGHFPLKLGHLEGGNEEIPNVLATWLETLAQAHEALPPPTTYRGRRA